MDLSFLVLVAARVSGLAPEDVVGDLDVDTVERCLDAARREGPDSPLRQAGALLCSLIRERPFGRDNDLIALIAAAQVLDQAGISVTFEPTSELSDLLDRVRSGQASVDDVAGFTLSRSLPREESLPMFERFTPRARQAVTEAMHAAEALQHNFIGTEHLLLGVLAVEDGIGARVLGELGVGTDEVRRRVEELVGPGPKAVVGRLPFTPRSKKVLELALRHALVLGHNYIGTEHLLLALLDVGDGVAGQILEGMGVDRSRAEEQVTAALVAHGWTPPSKKARKRLRQRAFPAFTFQPTSSAAQVRNQRLLNELTAIVTENDSLRAEVSRLRHLLEEHRIDPGQTPSGEQPAS